MNNIKTFLCGLVLTLVGQLALTGAASAFPLTSTPSNDIALIITDLSTSYDARVGKLSMQGTVSQVLNMEEHPQTLQDLTGSKFSAEAFIGPDGKLSGLVTPGVMRIRSSGPTNTLLIENPIALTGFSFKPGGSKSLTYSMIATYSPGISTNLARADWDFDYLRITTYSDNETKQGGVPHYFKEDFTGAGYGLIFETEFHTSPLGGCLNHTQTFHESLVECETKIAKYCDKSMSFVPDPPTGITPGTLLESCQTLKSDMADAVNQCNAHFAACDPDTDGDGKMDRVDKCSGTEPGELTDRNGCSHKQYCESRKRRRQCIRARFIPTDTAYPAPTIITLIHTRRACEWKNLKRECGVGRGIFRRR